MRSAAANHEDTYADMSFREAAKLVCKAWRRKHKILCLPLSHALSDHIDGIWTIRDSEVGGLIAVVESGVVQLAEDVEESAGLGVFQIR
jgi:hypothetical protein